MSDSGFDTLNTFKTDFTIEPIGGYKGLKGIQGGSVDFQNIQKVAEETAVKDEIATGIAEQSVDQTPLYNEYALRYANQFLPVAQQAQINQSLIAQQLGLGKRVTFDEVFAGIQEQIGPLPKKPGVQKSLEFLTDSINARTPYQGAAGIFDILAQATGKYLDRETAEKAATITHNLKMKEMAVKQMQDLNAAVLAKESEFLLKKMDMDDDYLQKNLSFNQDLMLKLAGLDIDKVKKEHAAAMDLYANPNRLFENITFIEGDKQTVATTMRKFNPDTGEYQYFLPRADEKGGTTFDVPIPIDPSTGRPNFYFSPDEGPQADADLAISAPNFGQSSELIGDFNTLGRSSRILETMLTEDLKYQQDTGQSRFGIEGAINYLKGETAATLDSFFNAVMPGAGTDLVREGQTLYERDKAVYPLKPGEDEELFDITIKVPGNALDKVTGRDTVTKKVGLEDLFRPSTYAFLNEYDPEFARNKVRENLIIYSIARALKPTGRLNVDDIKRASDIVNLQGLKSPDFVRTQLKEILGFLREGQTLITQQAQTGDKNFILDNQDSSEVQDYLKYMGIMPATPNPEPAPNTNPEINTSPIEDPAETEVGYNGEVFTMGGNI